MGNAPACIGGRDRLMNDARRLLRRGNRFRVYGDIAKKKIRLGGLDVVDPLELARHVTGEGEHWRVVTAGLIKTCDQVRAAGTRGAGAYREFAGELGLAGSRQRRSFLVANADPFDFAAPNRIGERIQRIADQSEYVLDPNLFKHADQDLSNCLRHLWLLPLSPPNSRSVHAGFHDQFIWGREAALDR